MGANSSSINKILADMCDILVDPCNPEDFDVKAETLKTREKRKVRQKFLLTVQQLYRQQLQKLIQ